ncbi:glycosyltransferase [Bacillus sp. OTU2372]|uniref:glycosyltransferase n=1 Tax=Bacillus sp. OTU2372 TaxID=3043858 RepID=UPI00313CF626
MRPKISVIIPVYKVEKFLPRCIESIIKQTYKNLEIILVNDGSPDKCGEICDYYAMKDSRIKVIHKENGGLSDARNVGLDNTTGEYISLIDSDDFIHVKFYEILMELILKNDADIAQCEFQKVFDEDNNYIDKTKQNLLINHEVNYFNNLEALYNLYSNNYVSAVVVWNKLYKKELFSDIRFPKGKLHEDEYTTYKLLYNTKKLITTSFKLYYYLQRTNSIMGEKFNIKRLDILDAYSNQISFYSINNLPQLKYLAIRRLKGIIRNSMSSLLKSDIDNKEQAFRYLVSYNKNNFHYFKSDSDISYSSKFIMYLLEYSPIFLIKFLIKLMDMKMKVIK